MPAPLVMRLSAPRRTTTSLPTESRWRTSPRYGHVTVCSPMCGCGSTRMRVCCGPNRSRKHHAPTSGRSRCGSERCTDIARTPPSGTSRVSSSSVRGPAQSTALSVATASSASSRVIVGRRSLGVRLVGHSTVSPGTSCSCRYLATTGQCGTTVSPRRAASVIASPTTVCARPRPRKAGSTSVCGKMQAPARVDAEHGESREHVVDVHLVAAVVVVAGHDGLRFGVGHRCPSVVVLNVRVRAPDSATAGRGQGRRCARSRCPGRARARVTPEVPGATWQTRTVTLLDTIATAAAASGAASGSPDADALYDAFVEWAADRGLRAVPGAGRGGHRDRVGLARRSCRPRPARASRSSRSRRTPRASRAAAAPTTRRRSRRS